MDVYPDSPLGPADHHPLLLVGYHALPSRVERHRCGDRHREQPHDVHNSAFRPVFGDCMARRSVVT